MAYYNVGPCDCCGVTYCQSPIRARYSVPSNGFTLTQGSSSFKWCSDDTSAYMAIVRPELINYETLVVYDQSLGVVFQGYPTWTLCTSGCTNLGSCQYIEFGTGQSDNDDDYFTGFDPCQAGWTNTLGWSHRLEITRLSDGSDDYYRVHLELAVTFRRSRTSTPTRITNLFGSYYKELVNPSDLNSIQVDWWRWFYTSSNAGAWSFPGGVTDRTQATYASGLGSASAPATITITGVG